MAEIIGASYIAEVEKALKALNAVKNLDSQVVAPTITYPGQSARMLAVSTVVLVHNKALGKEPTLDTLQDYDLNKFRDQDGLKDYVDYLMSVEPRNRTGNETLKRARYVASLIMYMFVLKSKGVNGGG